MEMEFPAERDELLLVFNISHSHSHNLQNNGKLSPPTTWCGKGKRFCLRTASNEFAEMNGLEKPTDETIVHYWNSIMQIRFQRQELELAKKKAKRAEKTKVSS